MNPTYLPALFQKIEREQRLADAVKAAAQQTIATADFAELEAAALRFPSIAAHVAFFRRLAGK